MHSQGAASHIQQHCQSAVPVLVEALHDKDLPAAHTGRLYPGKGNQAGLQVVLARTSSRQTPSSQR